MIEGFLGSVLKACVTAKLIPLQGPHQHYRETPLDFKYARDNVGSITTSVIGHNLHKDER